jgi:hypothetical protein
LHAGGRAPAHGRRRCRIPTDRHRRNSSGRGQCRRSILRRATVDRRPDRLRAPRLHLFLLVSPVGMVLAAGTAECAGGDGADAGADIATPGSTNPLPATMRVPFAAKGRCAFASISTSLLRCDTLPDFVAPCLLYAFKPRGTHFAFLTSILLRRRRYEGAFTDRFRYRTKQPKGSEVTIPWCPGYSGTSPTPSLDFIFCLVPRHCPLTTHDVTALLHSNLQCIPSCGSPVLRRGIASVRT